VVVVETLQEIDQVMWSTDPMLPILLLWPVKFTNNGLPFPWSCHFFITVKKMGGNSTKVHVIVVKECDAHHSLESPRVVRDIPMKKIKKQSHLGDSSFWNRFKCQSNAAKHKHQHAQALISPREHVIQHSTELHKELFRAHDSNSDNHQQHSHPATQIVPQRPTAVANTPSAHVPTAFTHKTDKYDFYEDQETIDRRNAKKNKMVPVEAKQADQKSHWRGFNKKALPNNNNMWENSEFNYIIGTYVSCILCIQFVMM
jgi:hypothetical protein